MSSPDEMEDGIRSILGRDPTKPAASPVDTYVGKRYETPANRKTWEPQRQQSYLSGLRNANAPAVPGQPNPKDSLGQQKVSPTLIPPVAVVAEAIAMDEGAQKYGPYNWRMSQIFMRVYLDAMYRHLLELLDGQTLSPDFHRHHLGYIKANASIILDAICQGTMIDDRPVAGTVTQVLEAWNKRDREQPPQDVFVPYMAKNSTTTTD